MASPMRATLLITFCLALSFAPARSKEWKSGELISKDTWLYGSFEASIKASPGSGGITGFVLIVPDPRVDGWQELGWEIFGKDTSRYQTQIIVPGPPDPDGAPRSQYPIEGTAPSSLADSFHTYRIDWTPDYVAFSLDGKEVRRETDKTKFAKFFDASQVKPMQLRVTLWAGFSNWSGQVNPGNPPTATEFDYISYASYNNGQFMPEWKDEFDSFDSSRWTKNDQTDVFLVNDFTPANANAEGGNLVLKFGR